MSDKDYSVPEQLDDNDFEKEKIEEKKIRKEKKFEFNKKQVAKFSSILLVIAVIFVGIYLYLNPIEKKLDAPEQAAKNFCAYFNSGNWKKINNLLDFKGYYVLGTVLDEIEYPIFDSAYKNLDENEEDYQKFQEMIKLFTNIDEDDLENFAQLQIRLNKIEACNIIQGTDSLYKLRVNFTFIYDGQADEATDVIYISNASGEYKLVYGAWMETILNYYQSIYMFNSNYNY